MRSSPRDVEIWDRTGRKERTVASLPIADRVALGGVQTGPRNYRWEPSTAATLLWVEALDGGNPKEKALHRDRLVTLAAPFQGEPTEVMKTPERLMSMMFTEKSRRGLITDYDRNKRWVRTYQLDLDHADAKPQEVWSRNQQDRYKDPGAPVSRDSGRAATGGIRQNGDWIFLRGAGASSRGDHPFLDRFNLATHQTERPVPVRRR